MIKEKIMLSFSQVVYSLRRPWKSGFQSRIPLGKR